MLPKSSKHYIIPTSEALNISSQLAESVIDFYYKILRKNLTDLEMHTIVVERLGTFKIKKKEIPKLIAKHTNHLSVLNKETFGQMTLRKDLFEKLDKLNKVKSLIEEEAVRKKEFFKNKKKW